MAGVEPIFRAGRDLQIEAGIFASGELDYEAQATLWLDARCCPERIRRSGLRAVGRNGRRRPGSGIESGRNASGRARSNALSAVAGCGEPGGRMFSTGRSESEW